MPCLSFTEYLLIGGFITDIAVAETTMPADLSVSASILPRTLLREGESGPRADRPSAAPGSGTVPLQPNPTFRLDPALNIVVLQLHDETGNVISSFPTEQQLNAYRHGERQIPETIGGKAEYPSTCIRPAPETAPVRHSA